jgi:hypothetical protein
LFEFWFPHHGDVGTHILNVLALLQAASAVGIKTLTQLLSNGDITRDQFDSFVNDQMVFLSNPSQIRKHLAETKKPFFGAPEKGIPLIYDLLKDAYSFIQVSLLTICFAVINCTSMDRDSISTRRVLNITE